MLVGPYLIVQDIVDNNVQVCRTNIGGYILEENVISKDLLEEVPTSRVKMSEKDMDALLETNPTTYEHAKTIVWLKACREDREILVLHDKKRCVIYADNVFTERTATVFVILGDILLKDEKMDD